MKALIKYAVFGLGTALSLSMTVRQPALSQVIHFDNPPKTPAATQAGPTQTEGPAKDAAAAAASASTGTPAATDLKPAPPAAAPATGSDGAATATVGAPGAAPRSAPAAVAPPKPKLPDNVPPPGMPAAMKLFNAGKYALAQKQFEKFVNTGVADEDTHLNLAYCLYYQRKYTQALKQFDWVGKYAKHSVSMQMKAQNTASAIRSFMRGVCPGSCLKPTDPRWQVIPSLGPGKWCKFTLSDGGWQAFSEGHMGDTIQIVNGKPTDMGPCPLCGGRGSVTPLKDGDPLPGQ